MAITVGDHLPQATFTLTSPDGPVSKTTDELFKGRKVVLVGVPGAFTPTCDRNHLPGYVKAADEIKASGVDAILVTAVNDVFVLKAWSQSAAADGKVEMLADGSAEFAKAIGLTFDATARGLGVRSQRYSMVVDDGIVRSLSVEDVPSKADASGADALLASLGKGR